MFNFFQNFAIVRTMGIYASKTRTLSGQVENDRANFNRERNFVSLLNIHFRCFSFAQFSPDLFFICRLHYNRRLRRHRCRPWEKIYYISSLIRWNMKGIAKNLTFIDYYRTDTPTLSARFFRKYQIVCLPSVRWFTGIQTIPWLNEAFSSFLFSLKSIPRCSLKWFFLKFCLNNV